MLRVRCHRQCLLLLKRRWSRLRLGTRESRIMAWRRQGLDVMILGLFLLVRIRGESLRGGKSGCAKSSGVALGDGARRGRVANRWRQGRQGGRVDLVVRGVCQVV